VFAPGISGGRGAGRGADEEEDSIPAEMNFAQPPPNAGMGADEEEDSILAEREAISACNTVVSRTLRRLSRTSISRVAAATVSSVIAACGEGDGSMEEMVCDVASSTSDNWRAVGADTDVSPQPPCWTSCVLPTVETVQLEKTGPLERVSRAERPHIRRNFDFGVRRAERGAQSEWHQCHG
jgi:hypothetical protein